MSPKLDLGTSKGTPNKFDTYNVISNKLILLDKYTENICLSDENEMYQNENLY